MDDAEMRLPFADQCSKEPEDAADAVDTADTLCIVPGSVVSMATVGAVGSASRSKLNRCHACRQTFESRSALLQHNSKQHDRANTYPCPHCDSRFNINSQLFTHITKKHGNAPTRDASSPHTESTADPAETGERTCCISAAVMSRFLRLLAFDLLLPPRCERYPASHVHLPAGGVRHALRLEPPAPPALPPAPRGGRPGQPIHFR